ncbi:MAG TPA: hypothetical protein VIG74_06405 [Alphaproteobacteria bacterium]
MSDSEQLSLSLPETTEDVFYVLENRSDADKEILSYDKAYDAERETLDRWDNRNWSHPDVMKGAFRRLYDKPALAQTIRHMQEKQGSMFGSGHIKITDFDVFAVPRSNYRLFDLGNIAEAVSRALTVNPLIASHIRKDFATRFVGRSYHMNDYALHVGNELTLNNLAAIAGEEAAIAVAGPQWKEIGDATYMKLAGKDEKPIRHLIAANLKEEHFAAAIKCSEEQRYNIVHGMVMNHWQGFAADYDGYFSKDAEGTTHTSLVTDVYLRDVRALAPLQDIVRQWTEDGTLESVFPVERRDQFMGRIGHIFMRANWDKAETFARQDASYIWIVPGGFEDRTPRPELGNVRRPSLPPPA